MDDKIKGYKEHKKKRSDIFPFLLFGAVFIILIVIVLSVTAQNPSKKTYSSNTGQTVEDEGEEDGSPMVSAQRELLEETGYGNGVWKEFMQISPNPSTHTNITYCFLTTDVEKISEQQLEDTENLTVHLLSLQEVKELLQQGSIRQALMAAPLWKYMAERII